MKRIHWEIVPIYGIICLTTLLIASLVSKTANVMAKDSLLQDRHCIIIDAGHGGIDGGATSCTGILESSINLEISNRLNDLIHFLGYDTKMIRESDISIHTQGDTIAAKKVSDLKERVRLVNETTNGVLISIHQNYFQECRYAGAQVFYGQVEGSKLLARSIQDNFKKTLNVGSNRIEKKASGIYLMEHIACTGVLIECGFLSNSEEEAKLRNPDYQKMLCCVIGASVSAFLS